MKIGFLTPEFPHPRTGRSGGIGTSILHLSSGLLALGHEVVVLVYGQDKDEVFEDGGLTFYKIKNVKIKGLSLLLTQYKVKKRLNQLFAQKAIDIVEAPDWTGFTSFVKPNGPLVLRLHGSDTYFCHLEQREVKWRNRFLEKRAFKKADGIISVSRFTGERTNQIWGTHRPFEVIPNGIDTEGFNTSPAEGPPMVLYFGTLIRKKGLLELPLIFNKVHQDHPQARLVLIGKDAADKVSGAASTWQLMQPLFTPEALRQVSYLGPVDYQQIKGYIAQATLCVFPTFAEALPVSWLEAMASEKAIVASNIGWATEIVTDQKDGFLAHPADHEAFARHILRLLEDAPLREKTAKAARSKIIEHFSTQAVARQSVAFYQKFTR